MGETSNLCTIRVGGKSRSDLQAGSERAHGQSCRRRHCWGLVRTVARRPSRRSFATGAPGDSPRVEVKPKGAARFPRAPPSRPSPRRSPEGNRRGTAHKQPRGGGGASPARKAPPPQSGGRGLLINSASAQAPLPQPAVKSEGPAAEAKQPESGPGPERARAAALRAAAGRRIMHTG